MTFIFSSSLQCVSEYVQKILDVTLEYAPLNHLVMYFNKKKSEIVQYH